MKTSVFDARQHIAEAREALQRGDREQAWQLGKQAAQVAPDMEDAWLVLVASEPDPKKALEYARKALEISPKSPRARRGWEWALARVKEKKTGNVLVKQNTALGLALSRPGVFGWLPKPSQGPTASLPPLKTKAAKRLYLILLATAGLFMIALLGLFILARPVLASIASTITAPAPTQELLWAPVDIAKPVVTPLDVSVFRAQDSPPDPAEASVAVPTATETPGTMTMEIVDEDSPRQSSFINSEQAQYPVEGNDERWIDVNLSEQRVYAYEGDTIVNSFLASTGMAQTPTVTGKYKIYVKVRIQDMSGPGYYLQDVPWVMFFYDEYGFHGTYWHNNFGTPMSRGCVNLTVDDAAWLYNWASVGTVVDVHY